MHRKLALVRRPSHLLSDGIVTHIQASPIDLHLARTQWENYVDAFHTAGWTTITAPDTPDCPDGVFIEDQVFVYADTAVLCRSGAPGRQQEQVGLAPILRDVGYTICAVENPATLDGGDILKHDHQVWVGDGGAAGRTNTAGIAALRTALAPHGASVVAVPNTKALHLKSAVTALPDGTVIGWDDVVTDATCWANYRPVVEEPGAHVVLLGDNHLLMAASAPRTAHQFRSEGWQVTTVDISEYEKLEGCVTCLSVRLRGAPR